MTTGKSHYYDKVGYRPSYGLRNLFFAGSSFAIGLGIAGMDAMGDAAGVTFIVVGVLLFILGIERNKRIKIKVLAEDGHRVILNIENVYPVFVEKLSEDRLVALTRHLLRSEDPQPFTVGYNDSDGKESSGNIVNSKHDGFILLDATGKEVERSLLYRS